MQYADWAARVGPILDRAFAVNPPRWIPAKAPRRPSAFQQRFRDRRDRPIVQPWRSRVELVPDAARVTRGVRYILALKERDDEEGSGDWE